MANSEFKFNYLDLETQLDLAKAKGYEFLSCAEYVHRKGTLSGKTIVLRVDIDFSVKKAGRVHSILLKLGIPATYFLRLHASEYNPFSFENYRILKAIVSDGYELGYHSEVVDQQVIWQEDPEKCLRRDLKILSEMFGVEVRGVASHGGLTGLNNLDFWGARDPQQFNLLYEAYDKTESFGLFDNSFYISDSEWYRWKCYSNGKLVEGDHRCLAAHLSEDHSLIYLLIHPDTYFDNHIYE